MNNSHRALYQKEMALRIVSLRHSNKINITNFAKILSVSRPTIYDLESGNRRLFADELLLISKVFNVSVEWLLGEMPRPLCSLQAESTFSISDEISKIVPGTVGQILDVLQIANTEAMSPPSKRRRRTNVNLTEPLRQ